MTLPDLSKMADDYTEQEKRFWKTIEASLKMLPTLYPQVKDLLEVDDIAAAQKIILDEIEKQEQGL